jgi:hypothetical protein
MIENKRRKSALSATVSHPRPGDFPIGSAKSRAAARASISARQPQLTQYDLECLLIEKLSRYLRGSVSPSSKEIEKVPAWQHGWELIRSFPAFRTWLAAILQVKGGKLGPCPFASLEFAKTHGRQHSAGDILRYTDLKPSGITIEDVNEWRTIWGRRVPEYSFPFRHEGGFLFVRLADYVREKSRSTPAGFEPVWDEVPQFRWSWVEGEALGSSCRWCNVQRSWAQGTEISELQPTIQAVLFCEDRTVKPLKADS